MPRVAQSERDRVLPADRVLRHGGPAVQLDRPALAAAAAVFFMFAMVKAFVPRYRYEQLMRLGWKVFLPIALFMVAATAAFLKLTGLA